MLPQEMVLEILARLPLKSIARFRSVSKEWRSLIDSDFFRDYFISLHSSSSISWSILQLHSHETILEIIGHHGCKTWGLTRSPRSLMSFFPETGIEKQLVLACSDGLVLLYVEASDGSPMYYVGNPLFQEWFQIPLPRCRSLLIHDRLQKFSDCGLVTKMQSGVVLSYKVVWLFTRGATNVGFLIYSSESGTWEDRIVTCLESRFWFSGHKSIALNGILHWIHGGSRCLIAYDFYRGHHADHDGFSIIDFPDTQGLRYFGRTITTSEGSIVYFNEFNENRNRTLRVWRLVTYTDGPDQAWQLFWEVRLASLIESGIDYFPVVMHPLNSEIIYLWSRSYKMMILFNLRTRAVSLHEESAGDSRCMDGCILSLINGCSEYMEEYFPFGHNHFFFSQYVLPRCLQRLPRPNGLPPP